MPTLLVTGANRGLGLELVRQYLADGWSVHACCREPGAAGELSALRDASGEALRVHALDVSDLGAIDALAAEMRGTPIDVLIANAGVYSPRTASRSDAGQAFGDMDYAFWERAFRINTLAPFKLAEAFVEHLAAGEQRKLVVVSSRMGSIARTSGGYHAYRSTKAALNMVMASLARDLAPRRITVGILSPGWVRTRMGGPDAYLSPEESVSGMRRVIAELTPERSGSFLRHDGRASEW